MESTGSIFSYSRLAGEPARRFPPNTKDAASRLAG
jgi:hypothetical protein